MSVKKEDTLYQAMIHQLEEDGFHAAALHLGEVTNTRRAQPSSTIYKTSLRDLYSIKTSSQDSDSNTIDNTASYLSQEYIDFTNNYHSGRPNNVKFTFACKANSEISTVKIASNANAFAVGYEDRSIAIFNTDVAKGAGNLHSNHPPHELIKEKIVVKLGRGDSSHSAQVTSMDFHPYVSALASTDLNGSIKIWRYDLVTRQNEASFYSAKDDMAINCARFDPSGSQILMAGSDTTVHVHDIAKKKTFKFYPGDHKSELTALDCCHTTSSTFKLVSGDATGMISFWDPRSGERTHSKQLFDSAVNRLQFSNGGTYLMTSSQSRAMIFDTRNMTDPVFSLIDINTGASGATFSEKDSLMTFIDSEKSTLWRFNVMSRQNDYNQHRLESDKFLCCDASTNPGYVIVGAANGVVKLFKSSNE